MKTPDPALPPIPMTAIVVALNESARLRACLESLAFCDQLIVVDLGSQDDSIAIATACGAQVIRRPPTPIVEMVRHEVKDRSRNDWIIFLDPDEAFPKEVEDELSSFIRSRQEAGIILVPWTFHFKGEPLTSTIWGHTRFKQAIIYRPGVRFSSSVHRGCQLRDGFEMVTFNPTNRSSINHFWMDSYSQLFEKHRRYIRHEGESRYNSGERFTWMRWTREVARSLKQNLYDYGGLKGGFRGVFLGVFHSWYISMSLLSLRSYQKSAAAQIDQSGH